MSKDKKLLKKPEKPKEPDNFWRTCPRALEFLPKTPCSKGTPEVNESGKVLEEPECPWWINSKEHNYCFWKYVHDKSNVDGVMPELTQNALAALFGWSNTKTHFLLKEAEKELKEALLAFEADELLDDEDSEFHQHVDIPYEEDDTDDY